MPKWFQPTTLLCAALFAISPFVIANAPYESTMGLVQKVFYYHMPSAWVFLTASVICGIASARFLATGNPRHDDDVMQEVIEQPEIRRRFFGQLGGHYRNAAG